MTQVKPYRRQQSSKKDEVRKMFNQIAPTYDLLNRVLSFGIDRRWRKQMLSQLLEINPKSLLDMATGTGDVALTAARFLSLDQITGIDLSPAMLAIARKKQAKAGIQNIVFMEGDSEAIQSSDNHFDAATIAFGVRNFDNLEKGLSELFRVLKKNGRLVVLEFTMPKKFPIKQAYYIYFKHILPLIGRIKSRDPRAYTYLFESVQVFPEYEAFKNIMEKVGFSKVYFKPLTFGICSIYVGEK